MQQTVQYLVNWEAYPLKIDSQVFMINFFLYFRDNKNEILSELIPEMESTDSEWLAYTKSIRND